MRSSSFGSSQQFHRRSAFGVGHDDFLLLRLQSLVDALLLQLLDLEEHLGQVAFEQLLVHVRFGVGLGDEGVAVLGIAQVEVVEVEALLPAALHQHPQLYPERIEGQILADAAHPPLPRAEGEGQFVRLVRFFLGVAGRRRSRWHGGSGRLFLRFGRRTRRLNGR